jgi:glycolate oxidase FAD binding subunit
VNTTEKLEFVVDAVRSGEAVRARGGGSKPALSGLANLELTALSGILEYDPSEYTFTALAGTTVLEVQELLERHGQFLPFDPVLAEAGATLGGTVASGLSGPGRQRYGGVRDFILAVQFVDGLGRIVRGGGKVVKNAAGFDLPKLHCGSLGRFGVLTEVTFKVFPAPKDWITLRFSFERMHDALEAVIKLGGSSFDLYALELIKKTVFVRLGGLRSAFPERVQNLEHFLGQHCEVFEVDAEIWREAREFLWQPSGSSLVKIPLTPAKIPGFETRLLEAGLQNSPRRYSSGGNLSWICIDEVNELEQILLESKLAGLVINGSGHHGLIGQQSGFGMLARLTQALDPNNIFASRENSRNANAA